MIEDRVRRAIEAHEPSDVAPPPWEAIEAGAARHHVVARRRRLIVVVSAAAALVLVVVGLAAVVGRDGDESVDVVTEGPDPTSTSTTETTVPTTTTTVAPAPAFPDPARVDGIYPDRKAYERNGVDAYRDAKSTATAFVKEYLGMKTPVLREVADSRGSGWTVRPNSRASITTTLKLIQVGADGPWTVVDARTDGIVVRSPERLATVASPVTLEGSAWAFEGHVSVEVREDGMLAGSSLGSTFVTGGGDALRPFSGKVSFRAPSSGVAGGAVLFTDPSAEDGSVLAATVVRVHFGNVASPPPR